jgi:GDP-4-dehydro-6-deoxy-D-mannose reductase
MRALVTGMTGFVGGHLVASLLADGWSVHGTLLTFTQETPPPGTVGTPVDITDADGMSDLIAEVEPEAIFHLAGAASVGQSFADPEGTWKVNVDGTRGVLEGMRRSAPGARLVIALSGEEYGRVPLEDLPVTEDTPLNPVSPYAESKVAADELCLEYHREHGLEVLRLRAFNQLGPGQDPRFVLPSICKQVADAEMEGDGACQLQLGNIDTRRDFLDVRDVVAAYRLLIEQGDPAQAYLAGRGRSVSIRELVDMVVDQAKVPVEVESDPSRIREGEQPDLYADPRALKELGWAPRIPLERSIGDTLDYWRDRAHMEVD